MLTAQTGELLTHIREGTFSAADQILLEALAPQELFSQLQAEFPFCFHERRIGYKWEFSAARSLIYRPVNINAKSSFPMLMLAPVFRSCVFVSCEAGSVTGIATAKYLMFRPCRGQPKSFALTTGQGFKLDKTVDGWIMKPQQKRTVRLSEELLSKRGWRFDPAWSALAGRTKSVSG